MTQSKASSIIALSLFATLFATFFAVSPARGQEITATITGSVTDPSGASVVAASVVARDVERGTAYATQTNPDGVFNLQRVPVGTYEITVTSTGFQTAKQSAVTLVLDQIARFNFKLRLKGVNEVMEVIDTAPNLQTDSAQVGTLIDSKTNDNLPLASRNFVQLTLLSPGALTIDPQTMNTGSQTSQQIAGNGGGRPYINGNREESNNFILDGVDNNQASENAVGFTPSPDAIQEFNVITQNASAEFGNFQGGVVSASIKSGTNTFHGDVFEFIRNDKFNANSWQNGFLPNGQGIGLPKAKMRWNLFGGTVGGPIIKNKMFFFADYEGSRFDHPLAQGTITVLSAAERQGNFSALCTAAFDSSGVCQPPVTNPPTPVGPGQIYDPCTPGTGISGTPCVLSGNPVPFPGNMIPANRLDGAFKALMASPLYPQGTSSAPNSAVVLNGSQNNDDQEDFKVDYNISDKDRLFARYSRGKEIDPNTTTYLLGGNSSSEAHIDNTAFDETHTFTSSLLNDFRFGVNYVLPFGPNTTFAPSVAALATQTGIAGTTEGGISGLPNITFTSAANNGGGIGNYNGLGNGTIIQKFASTVWQVSDNLLWSHGHHNTKFGFQMNRYRLNITYPGNAGVLGDIGFTSNYTSEAGDGQAGGDAGASFALGLPDSVARGEVGSGFHQRDWLLAGFAQDDWRIADSLTLNLGLRYEARTPWVETNNRQVNVDKTTGIVEFPGNSPVPTGIVGKNGFSRGLYSSKYDGLGEFEPRIGFAWTPAILERKTVIRGAFSVSSYLEGTGTNLRLPRNPPYTPTQIGGTNNYTPGATPYTTEAGATGGATPQPQSVVGATMFAWDPVVQPAVGEQWNLSIQHELTKTLTAQIGYVGQKVTHLVVPLDLGQLQLGTGNTAFIGGFNGVDSGGHSLGYGPNSFADVYDTASVGTMRYDALQAVLQKRASRGLEGQIAYTWGKCMTNNSGYYGTYSPNSETTSSYPYWQNLYDARSNWARCYYDSSQVVSGYLLYELPVGRGKSFAHDLPAAANAVVGNWSVAPIFSYHAGFPLAVYGPDNSGTFTGHDGAGPGSARPNCNGPVQYTHQFVNNGAGYQFQWVSNANNTFTPEAPGTFGTCPAQGPVIGPHYVDLDLSLQKNFLFGESKRLQFRADFLNAFNHPNLAAPNMFYSPSATTFGNITSSQDPRNLMFALKFYF
ncbi:MAG TPA: carboxypeptidase regulatory-like domain-containing protein [Candidatus Acidoferrum sp.]|nr:carboxypeptidase regulatory-like domain-containing protein [Candidatus Acidoferrum sp.]